MIVRRQLTAVALALAALSLPLGAQAQSAPAAKIKQGALKGAVVEGVEEFWGIPYAAPPVGELRWKPPTAAAGWTGERDASHAGPSCQPSQKGEYTEDCLFANVTRPAGAKAGQKLPVYVWIHGGAFTGGSGAGVDGTSFAKKGIVVVSVNYRLGRLGFFAHPALTAENGGTSANYGLADNIAALKWVQGNVGAFGGDPKKVTIGGESAGAILVNLLMLAPPAQGTFNGAIAESGFGRRRHRPAESVPQSGRAAPGRHCEDRQHVRHLGRQHARGDVPDSGRRRRNRRCPARRALHGLLRRRQERPRHL